MWNQSFFNFCFLMLLLTVLAARQPINLLSRTSDSELDGDEPSSTATVRQAQVADAMSFVETTWRRAMVMREWLLEFNSSQWEIFNTANPAETDLLDARFHVSNAEVLADAMSENDRAVTELTQAQNSLHAAQSLIDPRLDPQLKTLETEIIAAEKGRADVVLSTVSFENMKTELDHLIQTVRRSET